MRVWDKEPEEEFEINILPMIDVIFAILAFFILSTLFLTRTEGLSVNLPNAESATPRKQADFTVTVSADGAIALDQDPIELNQLQRAVQSALGADETAVVTIQADEQSYHGQVVAVMDELRPLENVQLGIATEPKASQD